MDHFKPTLLVISGPNGAGKSTFIQFLLPDHLANVNSFDRDKVRGQIERKLRSEGISEKEIFGKALRLMECKLEKEMDEAIKLNRHFVLETPLSHPDYWRYIGKFQYKGYQIQLNYLCLNKIKDCKTRVQRRVIEGGHYVDPKTIKGVYEMNLKYVNDFRDTFKEISLFDGTGIPKLLATIAGGEIMFADPKALKKIWIKTGMPEIALQIDNFLKGLKSL